jgi:fibronectin-binding autotransporter adhesin
LDRRRHRRILECCGQLVRRRPPNDINTTLTFGGTANLFAANDLGNPFVLNGLTFTNTAGAFNLSGGTLEFRTSGTSIGPSITQNSATAVTIVNNLTLTNTLTYGGSGSATLSGALSGSGGLTKAGASTLTLTGANSFTGPITVTGGVLTVSSDTQLGAPNAAGVRNRAVARRIDGHTGRSGPRR